MTPKLIHIYVSLIESQNIKKSIIDIHNLSLNNAIN